MRLSSTESTAPSIRDELLERYRRNRARTGEIFNLLSDDAYFSQPIALRHPIVFYEGHLPGFSFNTLVKKGRGGKSIDRPLEDLFARGIDPVESLDPPPLDRRHQWPSRDDVRAFAAEADRRVLEALADPDLVQEGHPLLHRGEAAYAILEHEEMHQETLLYMFHRLPFEQKTAPARYQPRTSGTALADDWIEIPAGRATLGANRETLAFAWDNEGPACSTIVSAFAIERHDVTNARYMEFVDAGGYREPRWWSADDWKWLQAEPHAQPLFWEREAGRWFWRGMFARVPLPESWPVYVTLAEASAFARWQGLRLPTEAEFQRAAFGSPSGERLYPWGDETPGSRHGAFDFSSWDPVPAGSYPGAASAWGVEDLIGNGWEWTATPFAAFPGFRPMPAYPEYSADFFDGQHFVMKGASTVTARELLRPTFRNWFRARYPYMYATFRCVKSA